jgi:hypothetical protein
MRRRSRTIALPLIAAICAAALMLLAAGAARHVHLELPSRAGGGHTACPLVGTTGAGKVLVTVYRPDAELPAAGHRIRCRAGASTVEKTGKVDVQPRRMSRPTAAISSAVRSA